MYPAHPIVLPPDTETPEQPPWYPGYPAHPIPPIVSGGPILPPEGTPPEDSGLITWHTAWSPQTGWVVVGVPNPAHPTPSK